MHRRLKRLLGTDPWSRHALTPTTPSDRQSAPRLPLSLDPVAQGVVVDPQRPRDLRHPAAPTSGQTQALRGGTPACTSTDDPSSGPPPRASRPRIECPPNGGQVPRSWTVTHPGCHECSAKRTTQAGCIYGRRAAQALRLLRTVRSQRRRRASGPSSDRRRSRTSRSSAASSSPSAERMRHRYACA